MASSPTPAPSRLVALQQQDPHARRAKHARTFILRIRPVAIALAALTVLLTYPNLHLQDARIQLLAIGLATVATLIGALLLRRRDARSCALGVAMLDIVAISVFVCGSETPHIDAIALLFPLIAIAYFGSERATISLTLGISTLCLFGPELLDAWDDNAPIPTSAYVLLVTGLLMVFVTRSGREIETALELEQQRDRVAIDTADAIGGLTSLSAALGAISHALLDATDATRVTTIHAHADDASIDAATRARSSDHAALPANLAHVGCSAMPLIPPDRAAVTCAESDTVQRGGIDPGERPSDHLEDALEQLRVATSAGAVTLVRLDIGPRHVAGLVIEHAPGSAHHDADAQLALGLSGPVASSLARLVALRDQRAAFEALQSMMEFRDRLMASVSHELRTPLTTTMGMIETLLRDDLALSADQRLQMLEHARDGGQRLLLIVEDLLVIGATRPGSPAMHVESQALGELIDTAIRSVQIPQTRELHVDVGTDHETVTVDRNRMLQVLTNLLVNAVRHGTGRIDVVSRVERGTVTIDVLDAGPGVPAEHVHELFLPFMHFSNRADSTGLGLALCHAVVEAHGGSITYSRTADGRTRFRVRFPADAAAT